MQGVHCTTAGDSHKSRCACHHQRALWDLEPPASLCYSPAWVPSLAGHQPPSSHCFPLSYSSFTHNENTPVLTDRAGGWGWGLECVCRATELAPIHSLLGWGPCTTWLFSVGVFEREVGSRLKRSPNRFSPSEEYLSAFARVLAFSSVQNPLSRQLDGHRAGVGVVSEDE